MSKTEQNTWEAVASFAELSLLCIGIIAAFQMHIQYISSDSAFYAFAVSFALACSAAQICIGFGVLNVVLYGKRHLLATFGACSLMGIVLGFVGASEGIQSIALNVLAGASFGVAFSVGGSLCIEGISLLHGLALPVVFFGPVTLTALAAIVGCSGWAACFVMEIIGVVGFAAAVFLDGRIRDVARAHDFSCVVKQKSTFGRLILSSLLLFMVWSYSLHHFFVYSVSPLPRYALAIATFGILIGLVAIVALRIMGRPESVWGFSLLKGMPILMVFSFIPLEYLNVIAPNLMTYGLIGSAAALVPIMCLVAFECADMAQVKPIVAMTCLVCAAFVGAILGIALNMLVGINTYSLIWATAPAFCLIIGIYACEFLLTRSAVVRSVAKTMEPQDVPSHFANMVNLEQNCALLAKDCGLTPREFDVLILIVQGYSIQRVSEILHIAQGTATTHKRHVYKKAQVHTKNELIDRVKSYDAID